MIQKTEQILEETVEQAVKEATIPLLAEIEGLKAGNTIWRESYTGIYDINVTLLKTNRSLQTSNTISWAIAGIELGLLIASWVLNSN